MPVWPVPEATVPTVAAPDEDALARLLRGVPRGLLGTGVTQPLRRDGKGDFASESGHQLVEAAIAQILGTRATWARGSGEIPWRTEFGSLLHLLRHSGNTAALQQIAKQYVVGAIVRWLPQVRVTATEIRAEKTEQDEDTLVCYVAYVLKRTADPRSSVLFSGTARAPLPMAA